MPTKPEIILYADDEPDDLFFFEWALERADKTRKLVTVPNGELAMNYLAGADPFSDRNRHPVPAVVVLDIHMPRRSGLEVLEWMRQRPIIKAIPVVVLTASEDPGLHKKAMAMGALRVFVKPSAPAELSQIVAALPMVGVGGGLRVRK